MAYTGRLSATQALDPEAVVTLAEADTDIADMKWSGATQDQAGATHVADEISTNLIHAVVTTGADEVDDTGAVVAAIANAIDKAVLGAATVDGAMEATDTTTFDLHAGETGPIALIGKAIAVDGFVYLLIDAEVVKATDITGNTITCERGAQGSTAETWLNDASVYWYCGADNTVIALDDETVWGTIASHTAAGGTLTVICGTEQMRVASLIANTIPDTMIVERGFDSTTAAVHADNAAVTQYLDENTCIFDVDDATTIVAGVHIKILTGGLEDIKVVSVASNELTVSRAYRDSTPTVVANAAAIFRIHGDDVLEDLMDQSDIYLETHRPSVSALAV